MSALSPRALEGARVGVARKGCTGYSTWADAAAGEAIAVMADLGAEIVDPGYARQPLATRTGDAGVSNAETIGRVLYTNYVYYFQAAGLVLLVAMIGAIVLTLRDRRRGKTQNIDRQHSRPATLDMVTAKLGDGARLPPQTEDAL